MANSYKLIASSTVGSGGSATIDFTSIPSTYKDLILKCSLRSSADNVTAELAINGVKTNMNQIFVQGTGSSASSGNNTSINPLENPSSATASTFASTDIYIPNYAGSTYKSISIDTVTEKNATDAYSRLTAAIWSSTSAITRLTLNCAASGNFVQDSTAYLYGVSNA